MRPLKYTREILEPAVKASVSLAGVLRYFGIQKWSGGTQNNIAYRIRLFGLDTSHFTGQATNSGPNHRGSKKKKRWQEVLVLRKAGQRQPAFRLRRALIESGVPYRCVRCPCDGCWRGEPLTLQVNHKNGDFLDDRKENVEFLCPNCHSQTIGWSGSEGLTSITSSAGQCRKYYRLRKEKRGQGLVVKSVDTAV